LLARRSGDSAKLTGMTDVPFAELATADLVVDRIYRGGRAGNRGDDPISKVLPVGNSGGFRFQGSVVKDAVNCLVLYTSLAEADWPDSLDSGTGTFLYYGDNRSPGRQLHDTPRKGNLALSQMFGRLSSPQERALVPPIFLFAKLGTGADVRFRGLLVPGSVAVPQDEQLVAIWRTADGERFQNYRAAFSVLNVPTVERAWLDDVSAGRSMSASAPATWKAWITTGLPDRLLAPRSLQIRSRDEQLPGSKEGRLILEAIRGHFSNRPHDFEACAAELWSMIAPATEEMVLTRPSRDGGRDAVGTYRVGPAADPIRIDFALEAKCYGALNSVGVREISRLISRLRHRNFGVLVTTSWLNKQAYEEVREDGHPVAVVSGADIVDVLKQHGRGTVPAVRAWLDAKYPANNDERPPDFSFTPELRIQPDLGAAPRTAQK
jgi:hypothetical protein